MDERGSGFGAGEVAPPSSDVPMLSRSQLHLFRPGFPVSAFLEKAPRNQIGNVKRGSAGMDERGSGFGRRGAPPSSDVPMLRRSQLHLFCPASPFSAFLKKAPRNQIGNVKRGSAGMDERGSGFGRRGAPPSSDVPMLRRSQLHLFCPASPFSAFLKKNAAKLSSRLVKRCFQSSGSWRPSRALCAGLSGTRNPRQS